MSAQKPSTSRTPMSDKRRFALIALWITSPLIFLAYGGMVALFTVFNQMENPGRGTYNALEEVITLIALVPWGTLQRIWEGIIALDPGLVLTAIFAGTFLTLLTWGPPLLVLFTIVFTVQSFRRHTF